MRRPLKSVLGLAGTLAGVFVVALLVWAAWIERKSVLPDQGNLARISVYGHVPAFSLTERSGRHVTLDDLRGLVWVAGFIYTECTETCPTQSLAFARLEREFADAAGFRLVSITVDPTHDTPEILRRYAERYGASDRWWFLTGDKRDIYCLAQQGFRLAVADPAASSPPTCGQAFRIGPAPAWASHGSKGLVMHSARSVLVDGTGQIRAYHLMTDEGSLKALASNLRTLLAERSTGGKP